MDKEVIILVITALFGSGGVITLYVKSYLDRKANKKENKALMDAVFGLQDKVVDMSSDLMDIKNMKKFDIKLQNTIQNIKDDYNQVMDLISYSNGNQYNDLVKFWTDKIMEYSNFYYYSDVRKSTKKQELENFLRREMDSLEKDLNNFVVKNLTEIRVFKGKNIHFSQLVKPDTSLIFQKNQNFINVLVKNGLDYEKFAIELKFYFDEFFGEILKNIKIFRDAKILHENDI